MPATIPSSINPWKILAILIALAGHPCVGSDLVLDPGQVRFDVKTGCEPSQPHEWINAECSQCIHSASPSVCAPKPGDRLWSISTRHMTTKVQCANLDMPEIRISKIEDGSYSSVCWDDFLNRLSERRRAVFYVHGNRMSASDVHQRSFRVRRQISLFRPEDQPIDWIVWSWPSAQQGILAHDVRLKAARTDSQGLYLAWVLRHHVARAIPTTLIGYSFGGRVVTGALHALAGGKLAGRSLPGDPVQGLNFRAGLVAPALESHWLQTGGYHDRASKNLERLVLLYNRRDAVLKRYWLIDRVRGAMALGYSGPSHFAPRFDQSKLPVVSRDCAAWVGRDHRELEYYERNCRAGRAMSALIHDCQN